MPAVAEHDVADDQQAPFVAENFQREIDRAAGALRIGHRALPKRRRRRREKLLAILHWFRQANNQLQYAISRERKPPWRD
jgi:hypothetical protein